MESRLTFGKFKELVDHVTGFIISTSKYFICQYIECEISVSKQTTDQVEIQVK
jgi:hypothetical protein